MTEQQLLLRDMIERLFAGLTATRPRFGEEDAKFPVRWAQVVDMGLPSLLLPEEQGGFDGGGTETWLMCHAAGRHAIDLPVVEATIATGLLARARLAVPAGILSLAARVDGRVAAVDGGYVFDGVMAGVPWGRVAEHGVGLIETERGCELICVATAGAVVDRRSNAAGENRDDLHMTGAAALVAPGTGTIRTIGALARAAQMAGASRSALELAISHVKDRSQFGKPLAKLQAVQHALATLAEQVSAAEAASKAAYESAGGLLEAGSAKVMANRAAAAAGAIAHQMHGAIGFTWEYELHHFTRRLIAWQSEFGNSRYWNGLLGALAAEQGADGFWPFLVAGSAALEAD